MKNKDITGDIILRKVIQSISELGIDFSADCNRVYPGERIRTSESGYEIFIQILNISEEDKWR